jgi:HEAT repeat protein
LAYLRKTPDDYGYRLALATCAAAEMPSGVRGHRQVARAAFERWWSLPDAAVACDRVLPAAAELDNEIVTTLVENLGQQDQDARRKAELALEEMGAAASQGNVLRSLLGRLGDDPGPVLDAACSAFRLLASLSSPAALDELLDAVVARLERNKGDDASMRALEIMGPTAARDDIFRVLVGALEAGTPFARRHAAQAVGGFGTAAARAEVERALKTCQVTQWPEVAQAATSALRMIRPPMRVDMDFAELLAQLEAASPRTRAAAARALWDAPARVDIARALVAHLDDDFYVLWNAAYALTFMGKAIVQEDIIHKLVICLRNFRRDVRDAAMVVLAEMGPAAVRDDVLQGLIDCLHYPHDELLRSTAASTLSSMGIAAAREHVLATLVADLGNNRVHVRLLAAEALAGMAPAVRDGVLDVLAVDLEHNDASVREQVARLLGRMGPAAARKDVLRALAVRVDADKPPVAEAAARALGSIGAAAAEDYVVRALVARLQKNETGVAGAAASALGHMGAGAAKCGAIEALVSRVQVDDPEIRKTVAKALGSIQEDGIRIIGGRAHHVVTLAGTFVWGSNRGPARPWRDRTSGPIRRHQTK